MGLGFQRTYHQHSARPSTKPSFKKTAPRTAQSITLFNLDKAICANNWDGAIALVGALVAQDETTTAQRDHMLELRRQLERYRTENAIVIDSLACDRTDPYILESAISTDSIFTGSVSTDSERVRPLGWEAAVAEATNNQYSTELITESVDFSLPVSIDAIPGLTPAAPIDLNNGLNVVSGHVGSGHEVYGFVARLGDRIDINLDVTQVMTGSLYTSDDSQLFVFDRQGNLIASADDRSDSTQSTINAMVAPRTDLYFAVVTSYNNDPILNRTGQLTGWQKQWRWPI